MSAFVIDLDQFAENLAEVRRRSAPATHMLVVKDDAYAHGLVPIVTRAWAEGVRWFGAFDVRTGIATRKALGEHARIFVWLVSGRDEATAAVAANLDIGVGNAALLEDVAAAAGDATKAARVHLKIDTGLHRNGIRPEEWPAVVDRARGLESRGEVEVVGVWSHIGEASDADDDIARAEFEAAVARARTAGLTPRFLHLAASAAAFARPEFRYDLTRIGAFAYGIRPAGGPSEDELGISPIASLTATVTSVDDQAVRVNLGSLDGLPTALQNRMLVATPAGLRTVTEISATWLSIRAWPGVRIGDAVTVFGGVDAPSATDAAEQLGTIGEEIVLRVSPLVTRTYR